MVPSRRFVIRKYYSKVEQSDKSRVSVLTFDTKKHQDKAALGSNALKRAKTLRHPYLLTFMDGVEFPGK